MTINVIFELIHDLMLILNYECHVNTMSEFQSVTQPKRKHFNKYDLQVFGNSNIYRPTTEVFKLLLLCCELITIFVKQTIQSTTSDVTISIFKITITDT